MSDSSEVYDAVIVGGGPAGSSAAIHLATSGARVLLAEQKKFPRAKLCGEFISPECMDHFERLGVAERILEANGVQLSETVFYASSGKNVSVPSEWFGRGNFAAIGLSRAEMDARLLARARETGVDVCEETQVVGLVIEQGRIRGVSLKNRDGNVTTVRSLVTIDATGRTRGLARRVEKKPAHDPEQSKRQPRLVAFKAHLENARGTPGSCEIYAYKGGYGGLNSVENGLSNLCFIARASDVRECGGDAETVMRNVVSRNQRAAWTLENARNVSPWIAVTLDGFGRRCLVPADGLLTVGDAASFIDPFTGSGMLMALESGELAASSILRNLPQMRPGGRFKDLANDYRVHYDEQFAKRLRVCAVLRRAAFVPRFAEAMIFMLSTSDRLRRRLARATHSTRSDATMSAR